jgi:hypothetical protein
MLNPFGRHLSGSAPRFLPILFCDLQLALPLLGPFFLLSFVLSLVPLKGPPCSLLILLQFFLSLLEDGHFHFTCLFPELSHLLPELFCLPF